MAEDTEVLKLLKRMDARLDNLAEGRADAAARFDKLDAGQARLDTRLDTTNARLDTTNARLLDTKGQLDRIDARFDALHGLLVEVRDDQRNALNVRVDAVSTRVTKLEETVARLSARPKAGRARPAR
jgi:predicted  nucleic acid-binding Zn-ribbon protein